VGVTIATIALIAVIGCLIPLKEITYTKAESLDYEAKGYTKIEQRDDAAFYRSKVAWSTNVSEVIVALHKSYESRPTGYVEVQNKDTTSGVFDVQIIFTTPEKQYVKNYSPPLHSGELITIRYQALDIEGDNWSFDYKVTPDTRIVTKQRLETLLNYWLHYR